MIYRVCGRAGSGKTEYMLSLLGDIMSSGGNAVVIVPEQQSLDYERMVFSRFGSEANMKCEILNFERLPNRTYREYGGLQTTCVDASGRDLLMALAVENTLPELKSYKNMAFDADFVKSTAEEVSLLKQNGVTTELLRKASDELPSALSDKISDIVKIADEYEKLLSKIGIDSSDSLTVYAENLAEMSFFAGKTVIIDSFYSFTWQEHRIIDAIARQATDVYISFLYDGDDKTGLFDEVSGSYLRVSRGFEVKDIILPFNRRFERDSLAFVEENIWKTTDAVFEGDDGGISFILCRSVFEECEAAASAVVSLLKTGMRMREIAVIARNCKDYDGIIDAVLKKHGINAFVSSKDDLSEKSLAVFVLSAIEACVDGFSLSSVKKYIKSGYSGLSPRSARLLLRYASTWDIRGKTWIGDEPWLENPDGYIEVLSDRQKRELAEVNAARKVISEQLSALYAVFDNDGLTVIDAARAIYTHLISCGADKAIIKKATLCRRQNDEDGAQKLLQLWEQVISSMEQLVAVCPDKQITSDRLLFMLRLAFSEHKVGTIPLYDDAVTIGDASMIRAGNAKAVILLGVNDGVFPGFAQAGGLLKDDELALLEGRGVVLGDTAKRRRAQEKLYFYTAITSAACKVTVIYNNARPSRPSVAALRLMRLLPDAPSKVFGESFDDISFSPSAAAEHIGEMPSSVAERLTEMGLNMAERAAQFTLCDSRAKVDMHTNSLFLSPSRLEKYSYCAFSYFGRYVLKLIQNKKATFDYPEIGTFVHRILELFIASRVKNGAFVNPNDDEIRTSVDKLTDEYIFAVCRGKGDRRFKYICTRLKNTLFLLLRNICDELSGGEFIPVAFEKKLDGSETVISSPGGVKVTICGTVDRVDEYTSGGKTYLRVVDYKTGATVFSKKALKEGLGLQMFLYMFALCSKENKIPAGVLYVPASLAPDREATFDDAADTEAFLKKRFRRSGLLIDDVTVVNAMENGIGGIYLPAKLKKDETFDYRSSVSSVEKLGKLKLSIESYIGKLADELASGNMSVSPLKLDPDHNACRFCDMKSVCRLFGDNKVVREHSETQIDIGDSND